jgi:hypothetical protein
VHDRAHLFGSQVDIGLAVVADDEAVPVAMAFDDAFGFAEEASRRGGRGQGQFFFDAKILGVLKAQVAELVDALVSGTSA